MEVFADRVWESLEKSEQSGVLGWVQPWREIDCKFRNGYSKHEYRGLHNVLTCALSGFGDPRYFTFNQIKNSGGHLKKGSKATILIAWKFSEKEVEAADGTKEKRTIPFAKKVVLFNAEQTEGMNLPEINKEVLNDSVKSNETITNMVQKLGVNFTEKQSNRAFYSPLEDSVTVPLASQFSDSDGWSATTLHELVHWTAKRVNRDCSKYSFDIDVRAFEELVAELGSMFLCMKLKINGHASENSISYISHWKNAGNGKNGKKFVYRACKLAEEACKYLLENSGISISETNEEEEVAA